MVLRGNLGVKSDDYHIRGISGIQMDKQNVLLFIFDSLNF
jgi:hypothetical protein